MASKLQTWRIFCIQTFSVQLSSPQHAAHLKLRRRGSQHAYLSLSQNWNVYPSDSFKFTQSVLYFLRLRVRSSGYCSAQYVTHLGFHKSATQPASANVSGSGSLDLLSACLLASWTWSVVLALPSGAMSRVDFLPSHFGASSFYPYLGLSLVCHLHIWDAKYFNQPPLV